MLLAYHQEKLVEAGCDEAGRGCLAGPVFAAAVILPKNFQHPLLNDSKQLSDKQRFELREVVEEQALAFAVAQVDHAEIDKINMDIKSGKIKMVKPDLNTFSSLITKYGVDKVAKANQVEELYNQQVSDGNEEFII